MKSLLLIVDPIPSGHSVQFELFKSLTAGLKADFDICLASVYVSGEKKEELVESGITVLSTSKKVLNLDRLLKIFKMDNESMLWLESWLREALYRRNSDEMTALLKGRSFDYVLNATITVPIRSDIWWIQGPPLLKTLQDMSSDNLIARIVNNFGSYFIAAIDKRLTSEMVSKSGRIVANSNYSADVYSAMGLNIERIVFNTKDLAEFKPVSSEATRDFVLTYIGKETDLNPIIEVAKEDVKIVGFGSKLPVGVNRERLSKYIDFRGKVSQNELRRLYTNALFTYFPFTNEPLGYVPLESMSCGTPVLTYRKQGPSETVVDGVTGWLMSTREDLVHKAIELWKEGYTGISRESCVDRASTFGSAQSAKQLVELLNRGI